MSPPAIPESVPGDDKFLVVGAGMGGVDEMRKFITDQQILWGMMRFEVGQGQFARTKVVFLHFNGDSTPTIKRGQWNQLSATAKLCLERSLAFNASIELKSVEELLPENIVNRMSEFFVVDNMSSDSASMMAEYKAQVAREKEEAEKRKEEAQQRKTEERDARRQSALAKRGSQMSLKALFSTADDAIKAVASGGAWNWVLLGPDHEKLPLLGGGSGSVDEMRDCAKKHDDQVMFGLLRMSFGTARLKRTKYASIHIIGSAVPAVKRGKMNSERPHMEKKFKTMCNCQIHKNDVAADDLTLEDFINLVKQVAVVDEDNVEKAENLGSEFGEHGAFSKEAFVAALKLEQAAAEVAMLEMLGVDPIEEEESEHEDENAAPHANCTITEIVKLLRVERSCNWGLIQPACASGQASKGRPLSVSADEPMPAVGDKVEIMEENGPGKHSQVRVGTKGMKGKVIKSDNSAQPFLVEFEDGKQCWYKGGWLRVVKD